MGWKDQPRGLDDNFGGKLPEVQVWKLLRCLCGRGDQGVAFFILAKNMTLNESVGEGLFRFRSTLAYRFSSVMIGESYLYTMNTHRLLLLLIEWDKVDFFFVKFQKSWKK